MLLACNLYIISLQTKIHIFLFIYFSLGGGGAITCRGDEGKDEFPWKCQEVHDVVSA